MAEITGGGLHFESTLDNDKLNAAIEETLRRIQGLSDGFVDAGESMDEATAEIVESIEVQKKVIEELEATVESLERTMNEVEPGDAQQIVVEQAARAKEELQAEREALEYLNKEFEQMSGITIPTGDIEKAFAMIDQLADENRQAVRELQAEYDNLAKVAGQAYRAGDDDAYRQAVRRQEQIKGEIAVRNKLLNELSQQADELAKIEQEYEKERQKAEKSAKAQNSLRTQIKNVRDEMAALRNEAEKNGVTLDENTGRYAELRDELGRLYTIQTDMQKQATILSNTQEKQFQGIISGLSGLAGGFSAATGTISLFAGKNDDLQKVMTRVQSVMAISIGLQQVSQTLYKDSAFQLVTVTKLKKLLAAATNGLSVSLGISNVAAKALMATLTLGLSLAITGIIVLAEKYISKTRAAKKEQEEFFKSIAENVYKPIGAIQMLSERWNQLGDNLEEKRKFIQDNKKDFEDLGWAVKGVEDAERVLSSPEHLQRFIDAQMAKARAMIYTEQAYENLKKQIELQQKLDETPEYTTVRTGGGAVGSYETPAKNWRYKQIEDELSELSATITKGYADAIEQEKLGAKILEELGIESAETYAKGSIGALQNAIKEKNNLLVKAISEPERAALRKEIDAMQKEVERMTGKGGETKTAGKDQFLQMLDDRKKAYSDYEKWLNSTDATIRNEARDHFAELLKDGESYIEYLYGMRSKAMESDDQVQIKALNSMIAAEMQKGDDKEAEKEQEHVKKLIEDYGKYYDHRVKLHEEYLKDIELLDKQLETETDPEKKATIQTAIDNRKKTYDKDLKAAGSGDPEYDAMLKEYATFEQKKQAIIDDYTEKRKVAQEKGDMELIEQLNKAQAKALSSLATEELTGSEMWASLFGNMDELTISQIDTLVNEIESKFDELSGVFDPIDLNAVRTKLNEARAVLIQDNPFKAIGDSLKQIFSDGAGESKDATRNIKTDWKNLASATQSAFDFVQDAVDSADFLKDAIGDVGATAISSLATIATVSIAVATAIKTAEKASVILTIIQAALAVVQAVANVITSIIRQKDKQIEKQIQKHAENVDNLQRSYENLEKAIDKALGSGRYTDTQKAIKNLEQQQKELAKQADLERSKKKTDKDKVREYENALQDAKDKQKELIDQLREDILGLDARSAAQELGDAFIEAFRSGEDAVEAFGKKADDIVGNIMQKMLVQKLLEQPIGQILDRYSKKWYSDSGDFIGFDAVIRDANAMGSEIKGVGEGFSKAMESLPDEIKKYFTGEAAGSDVNSWVGAIKGASEESVKFAAGQLNAMRINQLEATSLLRQQLAHLSTIANNTTYNRYLKSIDERLAALNSKPDSLRSQGLS